LTQVSLDTPPIPGHWSSLPSRPVRQRSSQVVRRSCGPVADDHGATCNTDFRAALPRPAVLSFARTHADTPCTGTGGQCPLKVFTWIKRRKRDLVRCPKRLRNGLTDRQVLEIFRIYAVHGRSWPYAVRMTSQKRSDDPLSAHAHRTTLWWLIASAAAVVILGIAALIEGQTINKIGIGPIAVSFGSTSSRGNSNSPTVSRSSKSSDSTALPPRVSSCEAFSGAAGKESAALRELKVSVRVSGGRTVGRTAAYHAAYARVMTLMVTVGEAEQKYRSAGLDLPSGSQLDGDLNQMGIDLPNLSSALRQHTNGYDEWNQLTDYATRFGKLSRTLRCPAN
jgi:hypothetical protein